LKAPVSKRLKVKYDELLSNIAFKFNLQCCKMAVLERAGVNTAATVGRCRFFLSNPREKRRELSA
jgi:hypothetical protein